jgi:asparagine synthase (glutamine-hydrolysing)
MTAQHLGLPYKEIVLSSFDALRWFNKAISALDQPLGDPVLLPFYLLFREIHKRQPQHPVLTGEGGDQLFGSWAMKPMIMRELYPEVGYRREQGYLASFHKFIDEWPELISTRLGQQLDSTVCLELPIQQAFSSAPSPDFYNQLRWVDLQLKGLQHILPRIEAMATAQHLRLQHPFFQADMIELGMDLPNHLKLSAAKDKVLLKMLARSYLPEQVVERRKQGMGVPTSQWFRYGLRPLAAYWLDKNRLIKSGLLNPDTVQAIRQQNKTASDGRGRRWGDRLWMLCALECWFASLC